MGTAIGALLLFCGAVGGFLAFGTETCTGNAPDSLLLAPFVLVLNLLGFIAIGWSARPQTTGAVALLPGMIALSYSANAAALAIGVPACELVTGYDGWEQTTDHAGLTMMWGATALSFWLGLAAAMWRGFRRAEKDILL